MIKEIVLLHDVDDPQAENLRKIAYAVNALIRKMNVVEKLVDRSYGANADLRVLHEDVDPNEV